MNLYILRHGIAEDLRDCPTGSDADRSLTPEGKEKIKGIAKKLHQLDYPLECIVSSPYVRARQTAEIVHKNFDLKGPIEFSEQLYPGSNTEEFLREMRKKYANRDSLMIVGHDPFLSALIERLLGLKAGSVSLKKGGFCHLNVAWKGERTESILLTLSSPKLILSRT